MQDVRRVCAPRLHPGGRLLVYAVPSVVVVNVLLADFGSDTNLFLRSPAGVLVYSLSRGIHTFHEPIQKTQVCGNGVVAPCIVGDYTPSPVNPALQGTAAPVGAFVAFSLSGLYNFSS